MWLVEHDLHFAPTGETEPLRETLMSAYHALAACEGAIDPEFSGSLVDHRVTFSVMVNDDDRLDALRRATAMVRTALLAADVGTPGWEESLDRALNECRQSSKRVPVVVS